MVVFVWAVGVLYNWRLKKSGVFGNLFVGFSVGMTFIFGGLAVGNPFEEVVWWLALTTVFVDLGEEMAADSLDVEGDRKIGSRSLTVLHGPQRAMQISAGVFSLVVVGSVVPFIVGWFEWYYSVPIALFDLVVIYSTIGLLNPGRQNRRRDIRRIYFSGLAMLLAIIPGLAQRCMSPYFHK